MTISGSFLLYTVPERRKDRAGYVSQITIQYVSQITIQFSATSPRVRNSALTQANVAVGRQASWHTSYRDFPEKKSSW